MSISAFAMDLENSTQIILGFQSDKAFTTRWSGSRVKFEFNFEPLPHGWLHLEGVFVCSMPQSQATYS